MPVGSIYTAKDAAATAMPLLLATITFSDGTVLRLSTHDLTGGATYGGNAYLPYIMNADTAATQALGQQGIDVPTSVTLRLGDSDYFLWSNYEQAHGFKGARLEYVVVMYDVLANGYSSDSRVIFRGICKEPGGKLPQHDGKVLTIGFASRFNMTDLPLPAIKIQTTCPWIFPQTLAERQDGADNAAGLFGRCGYSPDASGGNARGNLISGVAATDCALTADDCKARGMFEKDSATSVTGRFGGIQWNPNPTKQTISVRNYITEKWSNVVPASSNLAVYGQYVPMLYGQAWTNPLVVYTLADGNFVTIAALVCFGQVDNVLDVLVNDYYIPHTFNDAEGSFVPPNITNDTEAALSGWWRFLNKGNRDGMPATPGSGQDPFGSYCVIEITVPQKVAAPGSIPQVRVLAKAGSIYPADQISDILTNWAGWDPAELNSSSFTAAAALDAFSINYEQQPGVFTTHPRFMSSLPLGQSQTVADVLRGLRGCRRGILGPDGSGLLALRTKQTMADQQPAPITGSNYNTAIASKTADGTTANGYAAYKFDESNIQGLPKVTLITNGNTYSVQFQDADNTFQDDSLQTIDSTDIRRSGQNIPGVFTVAGANTFDQLYRLTATDAAEHLRGNWRNDTGGSVQLEVVASIRAVHLSVGDICVANWELLGISNQLFRVTSITPTTNFETATVALTWHSDDWYVDTFGQLGQPSFTTSFRHSLLRPSFPWLPYGEQPVSGDSIYDPTDWSFGISQAYQMGAGGEAIPQITISGRKIVNLTSSKLTPPTSPGQGTTANTGGTLVGNRAYYIALVAKNAAGELSLLSRTTTIAVPSGTSTNAITVPGLFWDAATTNYLVFGGTNPNALSFQASGSGTPSSVTLTSLSVALYGPPDGEFDKYRIKVRVMAHPGVWGWPLSAVTSTTIEIGTRPAPGFTTNQYAGYDVTWFGQADSTGNLPIANFRILSNDDKTLTLHSGAPDPVALGMQPGDVVVIRSIPTFGSDSFGDYIEDANWVSCFSPAGLPVDDEIGLIVRFIAGTGRGQTAVITKNTATKIYADFAGFTPDSTSRYIVHAATFQQIDTDEINNSDITGDFSFDVPFLNYEKEAVSVEVLTLDGSGNESVDAQSPIRDFYLFGVGLGTRLVTANCTVQPEDQVILADSTGGGFTVTLLPVARYTHPIYIKKISSDGNTVTVTPAVDIDGAASVALVLQGDIIGIAPGA